MLLLTLLFFSALAFTVLENVMSVPDLGTPPCSALRHHYLRPQYPGTEFANRALHPNNGNYWQLWTSDPVIRSGS